MGGILGRLLIAADFGKVTVKDGFGILTSAFLGAGDGIYDDISADGFGIRAVNFTGGASMNDITAGGKGIVAAVTSFTPSVRPSEFNPALATNLNDLATFLGKTRAITGVIEYVTERGSRSLGTVDALQIRSTTLTFVYSSKAIKTSDLL